MALGWRPNFPTVGLTGTELNAKGDFNHVIKLEGFIEDYMEFERNWPKGF